MDGFIKDESGSAVIELIMVMVFIIFFGLSSIALMQSGAGAQQRIIDNKKNQADARIAVSYVNARVRMNDAIGRIEIARLERTGSNGILIRHRTTAADFDRWIYFEDGNLLEALTNPGEQPEFILSTVVAAVHNFEAAYDADRSLITINVEYKYDNEIQTIVTTIGLRSDRAESAIIVN